MMIKFLCKRLSRLIPYFFITLLTANLSYAETPVKLLAFGDSLTHGYGLEAGDTFPERLQAALREAGYHVTVINGGNSGDTSTSGRSRLDWALLDEAQVVIVELGANDGLRGLEPSQTRENLSQIIAGFKDSGAKVLLTGMQAPRNLGTEYVAEFDRIYPELAEKYNIAFYPFFLEGVALDPSLNQADGIHPNRQGVDLIVQSILPYLEPLLKEGKEGT
ncbi:GDSL family lipase [Kiloniella spongiae]|uniref:GDSL family lipase n=1 Tax=Kiloniella spongiae TaxID=1489064 RepID=A0A0H2MIZ8_9PROT|nr:arylesterase [Kiloniella spongiae]KLN60727.1 GDSL family lipase [Kiloniella spongiae]